MTGSFLSVYVVQTAGSPLLKITRAGAGFVLSWPDPSTGFRLQSTPTLTAPNWADVALPVVVLNGEKTVTVSVPPGLQQYYRLIK